MEKGFFRYMAEGVLVPGMITYRIYKEYREGRDPNSKSSRLSDGLCAFAYEAISIGTGLAAIWSFFEGGMISTTTDAAVMLGLRTFFSIDNFVSSRRASREIADVLGFAEPGTAEAPPEEQRLTSAYYASLARNRKRMRKDENTTEEMEGERDQKRDQDKDI